MHSKRNQKEKDMVLLQNDCWQPKIHFLMLIVLINFLLMHHLLLVDHCLFQLIL